MSLDSLYTESDTAKLSCQVVFHLCQALRLVSQCCVRRPQRSSLKSEDPNKPPENPRLQTYDPLSQSPTGGGRSWRQDSVRTFDLQ